MKEEYEVIERKDENGSSPPQVYMVVAINFKIPTYVKFLSQTDIKVGETVMVDGVKVYYKDAEIGAWSIFKRGDGLVIDTSYSIKYTGGYSIDGQILYVDSNFPEEIVVGGKKINTIETIGRHHECTEKWLIDDGYTYSYAHQIATKIERYYVESLGVSWNDYSNEVAKNLRDTYARKLSRSPVNLDLSPYVFSKDMDALKEIKESGGKVDVQLVGGGAPQEGY